MFHPGSICCLFFSLFDNVKGRKKFTLRGVEYTLFFCEEALTTPNLFISFFLFYTTSLRDMLSSLKMEKIWTYLMCRNNRHLVLMMPNVKRFKIWQLHKLNNVWCQWFKKLLVATIKWGVDCNYSVLLEDGIQIRYRKSGQSNISNSSWKF